MNLRVLEYRVQRADMIIFLNVPRYICYWRIFKRTFKYYGKETPSSAKGCSERFNFAFFVFLKWVWDFKKRYPDKINEILSLYSESKHIYIMQSQKDVNKFFEKLRNTVK